MCVDYPIVNVPKRATYAKIEKILKECTTRSEFDDSALCKWINLKGVLSIFSGLIGQLAQWYYDDLLLQSGITRTTFWVV